MTYESCPAGAASETSTAKSGPSVTCAHAYPANKTVRGGAVERVRTGCEQSAHCNTCGLSWGDTNALAAGTLHTETTGHAVTGSYAATYVYFAKPVTS